MFNFSTDLSSINDTSIILRLVLSVILGGAIGMERGRTGRPAGLRTHVLVCLGSALAIMTNQYVYQYFGISDPTRMAAQVISGIGFLGVGTIIVTGRHQVKGLTTAATLWATACMGLAIGIGFYKAAIVACILITFVTTIMHRLDNIILSKSKILDIYVEFDTTILLTSILENIKKLNIYIDAIEIVKPHYNKNTGTAAILTLKLKQKRARLDIITKICEIEGVEFAEEI